MNKLQDQELINIDGGALKFKSGIAITIGGLIIFTVGVVSCWLRPLNCSIN